MVSPRFFFRQKNFFLKKKKFFHTSIEATSPSFGLFKIFNLVHIQTLTLTTAGTQGRSPQQLLQVLFAVRQHPGEKARSFANRLQGAFDAVERRHKILGDRIEEEKVLSQALIDSVGDPVLSSTLRQMMFTTPGLSFRDLREVSIRWANDDHQAH